jgi:4-diphosphocytidyl-2-C-methyl-D-erythritol kinase
MEERAHAKVNVFLRILCRRDDGFHEIETLMAPVTLYDCLEVAPAHTFEFHCDEPDLAGDDNLVVRAARLFFSETKREPKVRLRLQKRIPHGAGLGGGSSDAAATLRALNRFFETRVSNAKLHELAAQLGSDVSFFLQKGAAICSGRGEIVTPTALPRPLILLLLKPDFSIPSSWAYSRWQSNQQVTDADQRRKFGDVTFVNNLERPVFEKFIFLAHMKAWLLRQSEAVAAMMSGSGSTIFAVMRPNANAKLLAERAKSELDPGLWTCVCETI